MIKLYKIFIKMIIKIIYTNIKRYKRSNYKFNTLFYL